MIRNVEVTPQQQLRLRKILIELMRDSGCPEPLLALYEERHLRLQSLQRIRRGRPTPADREYLDGLCRAAGTAPPSAFLGRGNWGASFRLSDGRVLKLTKDSGEANAVAALMGRRNRFIADFYGAWNVAVRGRRTGYFILLAEQVQDAGALTGEDAVVLEMVQRMSTLARRTRVAGASDHTEREGFVLGPSRLHDIAVETYAGFLRELQRGDIICEDIHPGNAGRKGDDICIFDLSLSRGPAVEMPSVEYGGQPSQD